MKLGTIEVVDLFRRYGNAYPESQLVRTRLYQIGGRIPNCDPRSSSMQNIEVV